MFSVSSQKHISVLQNITAFCTQNLQITIAAQFLIETNKDMPSQHAVGKNMKWISQNCDMKSSK